MNYMKHFSFVVCCLGEISNFAPDCFMHIACISRRIKGQTMKTLNDYILILRQYLGAKADAYGISKIGIFGSVARNEQTEDSDVDVCVEMAKPDLFMMVHIKEDLQELFGKPVDLVRLRSNMNPLLLQQIQRDGVYA